MRNSHQLLLNKKVSLANLDSMSFLLVLLACFFFIRVNIATFGLNGKTLFITYQVIGHLKIILLLIFGYIFFPIKMIIENAASFVQYLASVLFLLKFFCITLQDLKNSKRDLKSLKQSLLANKDENETN